MKISTQVYLILLTLLITVQACYAKNKTILFEITTSQKVYAIGHPID